MVLYFRALLLAAGLAPALAQGPGLAAPPYSAASNVRLHRLHESSASDSHRRVQGGWFGREVHKPPAGGKKPHIVFVLFDDYGWADANWHRTEDPSPDVQTPTMDALVSLRRGARWCCAAD